MKLLRRCLQSRKLETMSFVAKLFSSHAQWAKAVFSPSLLRPASSFYLSHAEVSGDANFA